MFECIHTAIVSLIKNYYPYRTKETRGYISLQNSNLQFNHFTMWNTRNRQRS